MAILLIMTLQIEHPYIHKKIFSASTLGLLKTQSLLFVIYHWVYTYELKIDYL